MSYSTTSATKTEWAIQQRQLPKQSGISNVSYQNKVGYPRTSATKTVRAIQQRQLPKQCGLSNNVGYQNSVGYPTTSATKIVWAIQQRRILNHCGLSNSVGYQNSVGYSTTSDTKPLATQGVRWLPKERVGYPRAIQEQCQISQDNGLFDNADNDYTRPGKHGGGGGSAIQGDRAISDTCELSKE